jgi:hypothetical protein
MVDTIEKATVIYNLIHEMPVTIDDIELLYGKGEGTYNYLREVDKEIASKYVNYCALTM